MTSAISTFSKISEKTQKILEDLSKKSETRIMKLEANVDQNIVNNAWAGLGLYLSKQMKLGRAINIPKFGVVTFAAPEVKLEGVTNPTQRDIRLRKPVFIVNKDFVKGLNIKSGVYADFGLRPYSNIGVISGVGQSKANYTEIGSYAGMDKDTARVCVERVIRELAEKAKNGSNIEMEIPNLGIFYVKGNIAAINFDEFLVNEVVDITNKTVKERRIKGDTNLTTQNIRDFLSQSPKRENNAEDFVEIDSSAQEYLKSMLGIDVKKISTLQRPKTAGVASIIRPYDMQSVVSQSTLNNKSQLFSAKSQKSLVRFNSRPETATLSANRDTIKLAPLSDLEKARKKIKFWIRNKSLLSDESFHEIAVYALGPYASPESKLTPNNFELGISKIIGLNLEKSEIEAIFSYLDNEKLGYITLTNWKAEFVDDRSYLNYIRDVITKYNLQTDDVLRRMDLRKDSLPINADQISNALMQLDPSLNEYKASKLAIEILKGKEKIDINDFIGIIGCPPDDAAENSDWFKHQLIIMKRKIKLDRLQQEFEKNDEKNQGLVDTATFKTILMRSKLGMSVEDINRFCRYIEKDINMNIDYYNFIKLLEDIKTEHEIELYTTNKDLSTQDEITKLSNILAKYLKNNNISPIIFLKKIQDYKRQNSNDDILYSRRVNNEDFSDMLYNLFQDQIFNKNVFTLVSGLIDIDHDGVIDENDLAIYLGRYGYIDMKATIKNNFLNVTKANDIFPKKPLSEDRVEIVLRDLRKALDYKRISYYDFVKQIDPNDVGFISINQFNAGIDKVLKLSQPAKDGLFAYLDKQTIGLLDPKEFLKILKRTVIDKNVEVTEDNFEWQNDIMRRMKNWCRENRLKPEDAFRVMDADFDGNVSKSDLTLFLKEVMKLPSTEITSLRVDRLFKLIDIFKRDVIQFNDVRRFIEEDFDNGNNFVISGGKNLIGRSTFDWKVHAKQQLGLMLFKKFPSLEKSFEEISQHTMKMTYKHFSDWIEQNMALNGFNLTEKLMQQLFADLDPHKKGHLTQLDWENAFGGYDCDNQTINEIIDVLNSSFASVNDAFDYFVAHETYHHSSMQEFTILGLKNSLRALIPKRFNSNQIAWIWNKIANGNEAVNFAQFSLIFDNGKYSGPKRIAIQSIGDSTGEYYSSAGTFERKTLLSAQNFNRSTKNELEGVVNKQEKQERICEKLKTILNAANVSLDEFYRLMDTDNNGDVSNLEFMNALKRLRLGLTLKEIEDIVNYCDKNADGRISFNEFMKKFQPTFNDNRIFDRSRHKLKKIKENIYSYMLSPKDAFLQFNQDRTGKLTYNQFNKFIMTLAKLAGEEPPSFSIIKDLFDFIDIRKDGLIDMSEWMQSFRLVESRIISSSANVLLNKRPQTVGNSLWGNKAEFKNTLSANASASGVIRITTQDYDFKKNYLSNGSTPTQYQNISNMLSEWECSKEYDKVMKIIGKNRKVLLTTFNDLVKLKVSITFDKVKEILVDLLRNSGITINDEYWPYLLKVAERDSIIDYKFLMDVFKERCQMLVAHPKSKVIQT